MIILGISAFYHDSAACLVCDGKIIAAAQEERFTRIKHDSDFPINAIEYCLKEAKISISDVSSVAFYEKPFWKFDRILLTYLSYAPKGLKSFLTSMPLWIRKRLWMKDFMSKQLDKFNGKFYFLKHHDSHAASAFFPSPFNESAILTVDGVGEWTSTAYGIGKGNRISLQQESRFPHSLGLLYSAFTYFLGFRVNSGEYKLMGLAPYGKPKFADLILKELVDLKDDGSFKLNMKYFNFAVGLTMTGSAFSKLFGRPRRLPEAEITQNDMDIAASAQKVTEEIMLRIAKKVRQDTGMTNLCMAGGVALNCVANGKILQEKIFDNIWIQPASGDAGGALGAALFVWNQILNNPREADGLNDSQNGSFLGPSYSKDEIKEFLLENNIPFHELSNEEFPEKIADLINDEKVIGWFQGRMEFGPRALGGRSIIGDARSSKMQEIMNLKIKFRESFRPFAPSVIIEECDKWFDLHAASPFMLLVAPVAKSRQHTTTDDDALAMMDKLKQVRSDIPAVTHVDYSARVQTVSEQNSPRYYHTIKKFFDKYGCPVIINTSFNVRGEPIVMTPEHAFKCFMRTDIDYLVLENYLLDKTKQTPLAEDVDWKSQFKLD